MRPEERGIETTAMGREEKAQTAEGRFPALRAMRSFHLQQLQQPADLELGCTATAGAATQPQTE